MMVQPWTHRQHLRRGRLLHRQQPVSDLVRNHKPYRPLVGSARWMSIVMVIIFINQLTEGLELNETLITQRHQHHRYTIDELLDARFPKSISGDIDMDPCKSSK
uniref:Uncharacterized protein n=1 Tax=Anopheles maculatus TaxID=74869 RepID=A0A182S6D0_9DIPT